MTAQLYLKSLEKLGLTPANAGPYLGVCRRQSYRYASGEQTVTPTIALLLAMYLRHGLPSSAA